RSVQAPGVGACGLDADGTPCFSSVLTRTSRSPRIPVPTPRRRRPCGFGPLRTTLRKGEPVPRRSRSNKRPRAAKLALPNANGAANANRTQAAARTWATPGEESATAAELGALEHRLRHTQPTNLGFPVAVDFDYRPLSVFFGRYLLNNVGDPLVDGAGHNHTKHMEREIVTTVADLVRAPADDRWGYVTTGGTEGNLYALYLARTLFPGAVVYYS